MRGTQIAAQRLGLIGEIEQALVRHDSLDAREAGVEIIQFDLHWILFRRRGGTARHAQGDQAGNARTEYAAVGHGV
jgi:hypothetical protein